MFRAIIQGLTVECDTIDAIKELIGHFGVKLPMPHDVPPECVQDVRRVTKKAMPSGSVKKNSGPKPGETRIAILAAIDELAPARAKDIIARADVEYGRGGSMLNYLRSTGVLKKGDDGKYDRVRG